MAAQENPYKIYAILAAAVATVGLSFLDYKNSEDLRTDPRARPLSFTSEDFERFHDGEFERLQRDMDYFREWQTNHEKWGRDLAGENRAVLDRLQQDVQALQGQILYLYQQHERD